MMLRYFLSLLLLCCSTVLAESATAQTEDHLGKLRTFLQTYVQDFDARIGVAVISPEGDTLTINNGEQFPLMSVFKFHQALAVADVLKHRNLDLKDSVDIAAHEWQRETYSPLREKYAGKDVRLSIANLLTYTLQWSDNLACDILFDRFVSPRQTEAFLYRKTGRKDFQLRHDERALARGVENCYENWTTPFAAAMLLRDFLDGEVVDEPYRSFIKEQLVHCQTGREKLVKGLGNGDARIGHKTGGGPVTPEGLQVANNDLGFVTLPNDQTYVIAVFVKDARMTTEESDEIIAEISKMTYQYLRTN